MILSWVYAPNGKDGERVTIGGTMIRGRPDPRVAAVVLEVIVTEDREEAERWRQSLAKGQFPRTSQDRPEGQS